MLGSIFGLLLGFAIRASAATIIEVTPEQASTIPLQTSSSNLWIPAIEFQDTGSFDTVCMIPGFAGSPGSEGIPIGYYLWQVDGWPSFTEGTFYVTDNYGSLPAGNTSSDPADWEYVCATFDTPIAYNAGDAWLIAVIDPGGTAITSGDVPSPYSNIQTVINDGFLSSPTNFTASKTASYDFVVPLIVSLGTPGPPGPVPTSIEITYPTFATSTASTTFETTIDYTIGTDLSGFSTTGELPDDIGIEIIILDNFSGTQYTYGPDYSIDSSTGAHTYTLEVELPQSNYSMTASLVGDYGSIPVPDGCEPIPPFVTCTGSQDEGRLVTDVVGGFSVVNGLYDYVGFDYGDPNSLLGLATTTCSVTQLGGCVQNALIFAFAPAPDVLKRFQNTWQQIQNKPPFGYVFQTIAALRGMNTDAEPAFEFPDSIPFQDTIFDPFRTGLAALLWLVFGVTFVQRLGKIHI